MFGQLPDSEGIVSDETPSGPVSPWLVASASDAASLDTKSICGTASHAVTASKRAIQVRLTGPHLRARGLRCGY